MKLKALFLALATRAGIPEADAKLVEAMNAIPDFEVDDDTVAKPITTNLITELEAEARPTIKNKFTAQALNGIDALVDPVLGEIFDAADLESFKTDNKATTKKIAKLVAKAKELKTSSKPSDQTELNKTIVTLNETIVKLKEENETAVNSVRSEYETRLYFNSLAGKVIARTDVVDYAKAKEGKRVITDLQDTIDLAGGVLDIKTGKVMQKAEPSMQLFIDSKPVTADSMLEKTLTDNEYIKKSEPAGSGTIVVPGAKPAEAADPSVQKNLDRAKAK